MAKKPMNVISGAQDENVLDALLMLSREYTDHNKQEGIRRIIQDLFKSGCTISNPSGTKTISSKLILQILWKVANKMKIPDFKIYKSGPFKLTTDKELTEYENFARDMSEQIVTAGVSTVMTEGNFIQCMREKNGAFYKAGLYGDAHVQIGYDESNSDYPITFRVVPADNYFTNSTATDIRDAVGGNSADSDFVMFTYTMKQFNALWPEFEGKVAPGRLPIGKDYLKELEKSYDQFYSEEEEIEVGYWTSIDKRQVVFAGPACTVLRVLEGDLAEGDEDGLIDEDNQKFPYVMNGKPYLPTLHFKFFPSPEGYDNWGIGQMVYDIAVLTAEMDSMAYKHAGDNIWPITMVNSPNKAPSKLLNDLLKAQEVRDAGGRGFVVSETQGGTGVSVESFQSQPITQEWERAFTRLETQINRLGFQLDAPDLGSSPNEMSIMSAQENADAPIKQIIEWNATMFKEAVEFTMDFIRKFVPDDDQTPLNSMVDIETADTKTPVRGIPLGWVAKELRMNKFFVVVNSRDGTIPSNVMELAKARETMSTLPQGTPAWNKMSLKVAQVNGHSFSMEDLGMPQPGGGAEVPQGGPIPTETTPLNAATLKYGRNK